MSFDGDLYPTAGASKVITSKGDLVRGDASGNRERYGIGSTSDLLTVVGGSPTWVAPSAGGATVTQSSIEDYSGQSTTSTTFVAYTGGTDVDLTSSGSCIIVHSAMQENNTAGIFRGGPLIAGNPWTASAAPTEPSNVDHDYAFIAYPRTKFGGTHENRVGINVRAPSHALHVDGNIYASGNITAYSDIRSKKNIEFISGSLNLINQLRGVRFEWKKPEEIAPDNNVSRSVSEKCDLPLLMVSIILSSISNSFNQHGKEK